MNLLKMRATKNSLEARIATIYGIMVWVLFFAVKEIASQEQCTSTVKGMGGYQIPSIIQARCDVKLTIQYTRAAIERLSNERLCIMENPDRASANVQNGTNRSPTPAKSWQQNEHRNLRWKCCTKLGQKTNDNDDGACEPLPTHACWAVNRSAPGQHPVTVRQIRQHNFFR